MPVCADGGAVGLRERRRESVDLADERFGSGVRVLEGQPVVALDGQR